MSKKGTIAQLAQILRDTDIPVQNALEIFGSAGEWSVLVNTPNQETPFVWLAPHARQDTIRSFKTLDAAMKAALAISREAFPAKRVRVSVALSEPTERRAA